jgi:hypothetical protein
VTGSGELKLAPSDLEAVFGRLGVQLLTDDGRLLDLTFSEKELRMAADAAHVHVSGDLPRSPAEWRAGSRREPIHRGMAPESRPGMMGPHASLEAALGKIERQKPHASAGAILNPAVS